RAPRSADCGPHGLRKSNLAGPGHNGRQSSRAVVNIGKELALSHQTRGQSAVCGTDEQVAAFRRQWLDAVYPEVWRDARYLQVRQDHQLKRMAVRSAQSGEGGRLLRSSAMPFR